eukprot:9293611-Pyramimonas_sp.AAC.1
MPSNTMGHRGVAPFGSNTGLQIVEALSRPARADLLLGRRSRHGGQGGAARGRIGLRPWRSVVYGRRGGAAT